MDLQTRKISFVQEFLNLSKNEYNKRRFFFHQWMIKTLKLVMKKRK